MSLFSNLPASVLQAGAIFLSIIIEALPFVLIGSIILALLKFTSLQKKFITSYPKINGLGFSLEA